MLIPSSQLMLLAGLVAGQLKQAAVQQPACDAGTLQPHLSESLLEAEPEMAQPRQAAIWANTRYLALVCM